MGRATILDRLESRLERLVEGSVAAIFRTAVEPAEIGTKLERAMTGGLVASVGGQIAPNDYRVSMHPDDLQRFTDYAGALSRQLSRWLAEVAAERGHTLVDRVDVRFEADPAVPRRSVRVAASIAERSPEERRRAADRDDAELAREIEAATGLRPLRVSVDLGSGVEKAFLLRDRVITVGRGPGNGVVLERQDVSRQHARFAWRGDGWEVTDLGSTNGTRVNGRPVRASPVRGGDVVSLGGAHLRLTDLGASGGPEEA